MGLYSPPWVCPPGNDSFTVCVLFLYPYFSPNSLPAPYFSVSLSSREKKRKIKHQMYKWQLCWCKETQAGGPNVWSRAFAHLDLSPWVGPRSLRIADWILWYHNGCMWRGWWDSKGSLKQEVAAVDPHRRLLYRLTWMYPSPYAPIACPSMPSSFISLFLFLYHSVLYFSWGFVSFWVIWRK